MHETNYFDLGTFMEDYKAGKIRIDTKTLSVSTILSEARRADVVHVAEQDEIMQRELSMKTQGMERVGEPYMEMTTSTSFDKKGTPRTVFFRVWFQQVGWDHKANVPI